MIENKTVFEDSNCVDIDERFFTMWRLLHLGILWHRNKEIHTFSRSRGSATCERVWYRRRIKRSVWAGCIELKENSWVY